MGTEAKDSHNRIKSEKDPWEFEKLMIKLILVVAFVVFTSYFISRFLG